MLEEKWQPWNYHVCAGTQQASLYARNPFTQWEEAVIVCLDSLELSYQYEAICLVMHPGKGHRVGALQAHSDIPTKAEVITKSRSHC